jgi:hypothetical protein
LFFKTCATDAVQAVTAEYAEALDKIFRQDPGPFTVSRLAGMLRATAVAPSPATVTARGGDREQQECVSPPLSQGVDRFVRNELRKAIILLTPAATEGRESGQEQQEAQESEGGEIGLSTFKQVLSAAAMYASPSPFMDPARKIRRFLRGFVRTNAKTDESASKRRGRRRRSSGGSGSGKV